MNLTEITWETIKVIWENYLWVGREDIRPISTMTFAGPIDMQIKKLYSPIFYGCFDNSKLVGVISGHQTSTDSYRVRGIYVFDEYRGKGIAQILFSSIENHAKLLGVKYIWSYPRLSALPAYLKFGFTATGAIENTGFSGPNIKAIKELR